MSASRTPEVEAFYQRFRSCCVDAPESFDVAAFGDSSDLRDRLLALVLSGTKRATASLLRDYVPPVSAVPKVGDHVVAVDGGGQPRLIFRTVEAVVKPFSEVDDAFAFDEGEGDRTRPDWIAGHRDCFSRQAEREGFVFSDESPVVFERFRVVWPPEAADPRPDRGP